MSKTLFVNEALLETIELGEDFWIKIPQKLSARQVLDIQKTAEASDEAEAGISLIISLAKEWNLTEESGELAPLTKDNLLRLETSVINIITNGLLGKVTGSNESSKKK